jgi:hypothetical protein
MQCKTNYNWVELNVAIGHQIMKIIKTQISRVGIGEKRIQRGVVNHKIKITKQIL